MARRLLHIANNLRLKHKIAVLCTLLVVASTSVSGGLLYLYSADMTTKSAAVHSSEVLLQVSNYLDEKLKGMITRSLMMRTDSMFNDTAARFLLNDDPKDYATALSYFSSVFLEMRYSEPFISSVFLYTPKGNFYDLTLPYRAGIDVTETELFRTVQAMPDSSIYWLPRAKSEIYSGNEDVVTLVLRFSVSGYRDEVYLVIHLKEQLILQYLQTVQSEDGNSMTLIDNEGKTIASSDPTLLTRIRENAPIWDGILADERGYTKLHSGADSYTINYARTSVAPWTLINIQSERALLRDLESMKHYSALILLISITVSFAVGYFISARIGRPIVALERTMQQVRLTRFDVRFEYPHEDEVGKLGRTFNYMTEEIQSLIEQQSRYIEQLEREKERVQEEQRLKRLAELKALQSQMTPHFLYNTLDSIKWMAESNGQPAIVRMITALASFFRTTLSRGKEIITIEEELSHVSSYLAIQKIRYADRFTYDIAMDERVQQCLTVKFVLQPLVENAIYHGIKQQTGTGFIRISAALAGDTVELTVEDNGPGIHPVKLQLLRKRLLTSQEAHAEGYGLYNVNDRIKLYFGDAFGIRIDSEPGRGTRVTAKLPIANQEEVAANV